MKPIAEPAARESSATSRGARLSNGRAEGRHAGLLRRSARRSPLGPRRWGGHPLACGTSYLSCPVPGFRSTFAQSFPPLGRIACDIRFALKRKVDLILSLTRLLVQQTGRNWTLYQPDTSLYLDLVEKGDGATCRAETKSSSKSGQMNERPETRTLSFLGRRRRSPGMPRPVAMPARRSTTIIQGRKPAATGPIRKRSWRATARFGRLARS